MQTSSRALTVLAVLFLSSSSALPAAAADPPAPAAFRAGFAERDITPDIGMEMPGNYGKVYGRSVHDPCKVRAAVFDDGAKRVALVGVDALMLRRETVLAARKAITERCGIPPDHVLVGASHSHSSGPTGMVLPGEFDHASPLVQKLAYEKSSAADPRYLARVERAIAEAVCLASEQRVEARLSFGSGREERVSFNRRLRMKNGLTYSHPGRGNPEVLGYAGPIDPEVGVIGAWDGGGRLLGTIVNFSCHATTNPGGFSANWIHYLEETIRGGLGARAPVVFLQGACGDITQVDNLSPHADPPGEVQARRVGGCVGAEAIKVLLLAEPGHGGPLDALSRTFPDAGRPAPAQRVRRSLELVERPESEVGHTEWVFAKEVVLLDALLRSRPEEEVEVQAIQVGPAVFLSNPAEYFVEYGLEMKRRSPFPFTWVVELANGCVGYVPTEEALGPGGGGYETRLTSYSNLEPAAGRRFLEACLELAGRMRPGAVPQPPPARPFSAPWSYGNVPPEVR